MARQRPEAIARSPNAKTRRLKARLRFARLRHQATIVQGRKQRLPLSSLRLDGPRRRGLPRVQLNWRCATPDRTGQPQGRRGERQLVRPGLNPTYQDFATHYGTAILPARPRKPRDKAKVEAAVLVVERWILARLRNQRFFSLSELNAAIAKLVVDLNDGRCGALA